MRGDISHQLNLRLPSNFAVTNLGLSYKQATCGGAEGCNVKPMRMFVGALAISLLLGLEIAVAREVREPRRTRIIEICPTSAVYESANRPGMEQQASTSSVWLRQAEAPVSTKSSRAVSCGYRPTNAPRTGCKLSELDAASIRLPEYVSCD